MDGFIIHKVAISVVLFLLLNAKGNALQISIFKKKNEQNRYL